jgi:hypothetical protein
MRRHVAPAAVALVGLAAAVAGATRVGAGDKAEAVQPFKGRDLVGWKLKGDAARSKWVVGGATQGEKDPRKLAVAAFPPQADGGPAARGLPAGTASGRQAGSARRPGAKRIGSRDGPST